MGYYCPYCGTYLNDKEKVCSSCGRELDLQQPEQSVTQQSEQTMTQQSEQTMTQQSEQTMTQQPEQTMTQQPGKVAMQQSEWENQPQQYVQRGWNNQPQPNMQQPGWNNQPKSNTQQPGWNNQPQSNTQQRGWNNQPQPNMQQPGWNNQPQQYVQQPQTSEQPIQQPQSPIPPVQQLPQKSEPTMKWFKFVIWLQLFVSAIVAAGNAVLLLTGYAYGNIMKLIDTDLSSGIEEFLENASRMKELVYGYYPSLKMVDMGCGIAYVVVALLAIIIRFRLSGKKKNGPSLYIFYLFVEVLISVVYMGLTIHAIQTLTIDASFIASVASIVWSIILIFLNMVYFKKRKHMFCN